MIGSHVGLMLKPEQLQRKTQTVTLAVISSVLLIAGALGLSYLLMNVFSLSAATSLLSMAPGGMDPASVSTSLLPSETKSWIPNSRSNFFT